MKDLGNLSYFLGLEISSSPSGYYLSQEKYASDLLNRSGITDSSTFSTLLDSNVFFDADWASDPTDRRYTTGYCFYLSDTLISWRSKKQSIVSRFSTEFEYRALAYATSELLWLRWLLTDVGVPKTSPTILHYDNRNAIQIAHNDVFHERTCTLRMIVTLFTITFRATLSISNPSLP
ncbi:hypothetical protein IC582_014882 [Cucumis melo]